MLRRDAVGRGTRAAWPAHGRHAYPCRVPTTTRTRRAPAKRRPSRSRAAIAKARQAAADRRRVGIATAVVAAATLAIVVLAWVLQPRIEPWEQTATVTGDVPSGVAGWDREQLTNAAIILRAGDDLGLSDRDRTIAVMTAMGESSLIVVDFGDTAGPDSRGLFQQRTNWGPYEVRMDAYGSAVLFYQALDDVGARDGMAPTLVAHTVQVNQDPYHYAPYWDDAVAVVAALDAARIAVEVEPV